jgi:hypothetical protein
MNPGKRRPDKCDEVLLLLHKPGHVQSQNRLPQLSSLPENFEKTDSGIFYRSPDVMCKKLIPVARCNIQNSLISVSTFKSDPFFSILSGEKAVQLFQRDVP